MIESEISNPLKIDLTRKISCLLVISISIIVYINTLQNDFVYDDRQEVLENHYIRDIRYLPEMLVSPFWEFITVSPQWGFIPEKEKISSNYYRPVKSILYTLTYHLFGLKAWGFHLVNIVLNALVSVLVFLISLRFMGRISYSLICSILFAIHPVHTEAVDWISSMGEVTFTLFYLIAFYIYTNKDHSLLRLNISASMFFLSLLSKETAITLPVVLILYDYIFKKIEVRRYIPYLTVVVIYILLRIYALGGFIPQTTRADINNYQLLLNASSLLIRYLLKLLFPIDMNMYIMYQPLLSLDIIGCLSFFFSLFILFITLYHLKKKRVWTFFFLWIPINLMPALYIKGLGGALMAERYLYLPSVGFIILMGYLLLQTDLYNSNPPPPPFGKEGKEGVKGNNSPCPPLVKGGYGGVTISRKEAKISLIFLAIIFSLYSFQTIKRNADWRDEVTLYSKTLAQSPLSSSMHYNLANAYIKKGLDDKAIYEFKEALKIDYDLYDAHISLGNIYNDRGIFDKAIEEYKYALKLFPEHAGININLGIVYQKLGMIDDAIKRFKEAARVTPHYSDAHYNLANAYKNKGMTGLAADEYREAIKADIHNKDAYYHLADIYYQNGIKDDAIKVYEDLLSIDKMQLAAYINLGNIYRDKGMIEAAIKKYKEAIKINPQSPDAHNNLANIYALKGLYKRAEKEYHEVLKTNPDFFGAHYNLGNIYYQKGELTKALIEYKKARGIKPDFKGLGEKIKGIKRLMDGKRDLFRKKR
ncbi:MAG: tetratricopeptide repeat protein [Nitrospirota bacterium]